MEKTNSKMLALLIIPLLLIPIFGVGSAHWYGSVTKQYKMHVGCTDAQIGTYKVLSPWNDDLIQRWPPDDLMPTKTISISTRVFPGWYCWIGFVIQNVGQFPVWIDEPQFQVNDPEGVWAWFIHMEYFYGQIIDGTSCGWPRNGVQEEDVYENVKLKPKQPKHVAPPPPGDIASPVYLEAYGPHTENSMAMWIFLQLREDCPLDGFELQISITITATMALPPGP